MNISLYSFFERTMTLHLLWMLLEIECGGMSESQILTIARKLFSTNCHTRGPEGILAFVREGGTLTLEGGVPFRILQRLYDVGSQKLYPQSSMQLITDITSKLSLRCNLARTNVVYHHVHSSWGLHVSRSKRVEQHPNWFINLRVIVLLFCLRENIC